MDTTLPLAQWCEPLLQLLEDLPLPDDLLVRPQALFAPAGRQMQKKRVLLRQFEAAATDSQTCPLHRRTLDAAYSLERLWQTNPTDRQQAYLRRCFRYYGELGLTGVLLRVQGRPIGYSITAACGETGGYILALRALESPVGATAALYRQTALLLCESLPGLRWINLGWTGGEQERQNRLSYRPLTAGQAAGQERVVADGGKV